MAANFAAATPTWWASSSHCDDFRGDTRTAVILGSGGVLLSVLEALEVSGYRQVTIVARSESKVRGLLGSKAANWHFLAWGAPLPVSDLLVNATPLGMAGQPALPYDAASLGEGGVLFEMIYNPLVTPLLADGRRRGLHCVDGLRDAGVASRAVVR